jgi:hypothetical protein
MDKHAKDDSYSEQETEQRVIAALRAAVKPRTQMKDIPRKREGRKAGKLDFPPSVSGPKSA